MGLVQVHERFEDACYAFLVKLRWPKGVRCPRCGSPKVYRTGGDHTWRWICKQSHAKNGYRFSPLVQTMFENTNIPLRIWFQVILFMCRGREGVSAAQVQRRFKLGSYRSAWYMCHRIRVVMLNRGSRDAMGVLRIHPAARVGERGDPKPKFQ
jgi:hypothetical protein